MSSVAQDAPLDIYQDKDDIFVRADLPGMTKDDIKVSIAGSTLTIRGERKEEHEVKEENFYQKERSCGTVTRVVELPVEVEADRTEAAFKDGVLTIRMPINETSRGLNRTTIPIK